ncbi:helix-turn-helix domain-containing protein [Shewanella cyperi]|uniref:Helix-turn-helix domain-containing protein n=1 Tax=Shewanella cyperi TaxID=2814292 RepID=A0A974XNT6_9GAMM|nr:helix-turn-helix domain-containing protein [Shewanella cyperi]QSX31804.1 helix-turn-helix domain-containing protein [Shewanella cyperi]QSX42576.1 helix-turn-helix domain-containing protein [Shewanella cyperi]
MDIAEVAKASGLPASTLRYYEEKGLIQACGRSGLRRQFSDSVLERLALISLGGAVGFSLDEMVRMFSTDAGSIDRGLLAAKADELDRRINELVAMRDGLRHAAECRAASHFECPKFLRILKVAGRGRSRSPNKLKAVRKA